jgi:plastocyanin
VTPPASGGPTTTGATGSTGATGTAIANEAFAYDPTPLTVAPGATIDVTNRDAQAHTVTSDVKDLFLADDINKGKPVTFKAPTRAGTYTYHCEYHSGMHGTLVVKG